MILIAVYIYQIQAIIVIHIHQIMNVMILVDHVENVMILVDHVEIVVSEIAANI